MSDNGNSVQEFGQELIRAREFKNMDLEQVADITKISIAYLEAMEKGEWDVLPRPYMEVFLKAYADAVGMNIPKVMKKYHEMVCPEIYPEERVEPELPSQEEAPLSEFRWFPAVLQMRSFKYIIGAIALLVLLIIIAGIIIPNGEDIETRRIPGSTGEVERAESSSAGDLGGDSLRIDSERPNVAVTPQTENLTEAQRPASQKFTVTALAHERCWLYATLDKADIRDVYLYPDEEYALNAQEEIHLVVGNAGGLKLNMNGEIIDTLGPKDKPVTVVIGRDGIISQRLGAWHLNYSREMQSASRDTTSHDSLSPQ